MVHRNILIFILILYFAGQKESINRYFRRTVKDIPLFGYTCVIDTELARPFCFLFLSLPVDTQLGVSARWP